MVRNAWGLRLLNTERRLLDAWNLTSQGGQSASTATLEVGFLRSSRALAARGCGIAAHYLPRYVGAVQPSSQTADAVRRDLARLVDGGRASNDEADRIAYARDLWPRQQIRTRAGEAAIAPPGVVVWPASVAEVVEVVRYAHEHTLPVVPYGAGSGVCGGILPSPDAILLDVKRMRAIARVSEDELECQADAGIIGQDLEDDLNALGFTLGHFPSSIYCSSLGGWIAGRSAGQCSGRYGKIEDMVRALTVVDGTGRVWRCEHRGENASLLPMIIGSEGILGVVTDARLRIAPVPYERRFSSWLFDQTEDGLNAIRQIYQAGLRPAVARLYDPFDSMISRSVKKTSGRSKRETSKPSFAMRALVRALRTPGAINGLVNAIPDPTMGGAKMVLVWEDDPLIAAAELAEAERICASFPARSAGEEPARHWIEHRHAVSYRQSAFFNAGAFVDTMEVASTWSRLWPMYEAVRGALSKHVFVMAHFSHAYPDGASIYFTFAGAAKDDPASLELYDETWRTALDAVIEAGGTLSHHHGVGRSKAPKMRKEQGAAIDVVRALKAVMDPKGILNPGSLIPQEVP